MPFFTGMTPIESARLMKRLATFPPNFADFPRVHTGDQYYLPFFSDTDRKWCTAWAARRASLICEAHLDANGPAPSALDIRLALLDKSLETFNVILSFAKPKDMEVWDHLMCMAVIEAHSIARRESGFTLPPLDEVTDEFVEALKLFLVKTANILDLEPPASALGDEWSATIAPYVPDRAELRAHCARATVYNDDYDPRRETADGETCWLDGYARPASPPPEKSEAQREADARQEERRRARLAKAKDRRRQRMGEMQRRRNEERAAGAEAEEKAPRADGGPPGARSEAGGDGQAGGGQQAGSAGAETSEPTAAPEPAGVPTPATPRKA